MIASQAGRSAEIRQGDASYRPASRASGWPRTGSRPVQFGLAVRRNPTTAATTKPTSNPRNTAAEVLNDIQPRTRLVNSVRYRPRGVAHHRGDDQVEVFR